MTRIVGVADCAYSANTSDTLITYALGSCIGVAVHDPAAKVGGLLHFMLPESAIDREKASRNPYMFADTGVPMLFHQCYSLGAQKRRMVVRIAGGAQVMDDNGVFNIGRRNYLALRRILWKAGVLVEAEEIGGTTSRTVRLEVGTGRFLLKGGGEAEREICGKVASGEGAMAWASR